MRGAPAKLSGKIYVLRVDWVSQSPLCSDYIVSEIRCSEIKGWSFVEKVVYRQSEDEVQLVERSLCCDLSGGTHWQGAVCQSERRPDCYRQQ